MYKKFKEWFILFAIAACGYGAAQIIEHFVRLHFCY